MIIGIDVSKAKLDCLWIRDLSAMKVKSKVQQNTPTGHKALLEWATNNLDRAHAVITEKANGNYLVSVRAPLNNKQGAAELCMQFPTGGGRTAAAGINDLPRDTLDTFVETFSDTYSK